MSLDPLLSADWPIQVHATAALLAVILGAMVLWRRKGTGLHKALGRLWVLLMLVAATSALFINEIRMIGPFGPIHLFSLLTYWTLGQGLWAIVVQKDVRRHRIQMQSLYVFALMLAGAFTLLPGRRMHQVLFGADAGWPHSLLAIGTILLIAALVWRRLSPPRRQAV
jgi:uncharacterized membrane protein